MFIYKTSKLDVLFSSVVSKKTLNFRP